MNGGIKYWNRRLSGGTPSGRIHCVLAMALFCAVGAVAQDGYWIKSSGGSWASTANWDSADGMAAGADSTAYFGFAREAVISPSATFTFDGAQTIGNLCFTTQGGPANWNFGGGSSGSLTLNSTFEAPQITITSPTLQVTLKAVVAGGAGLEKDGAGTLVLAANNTYTGLTLVNSGGLNVTGTLGTGGVDVTHATLSGSGVINGPVVVGSGGILSLGNTSGALTINSSLVLQPGSTTSVALGASSGTQAAVLGLSSVTYGGTLVVSNLAGALSLGQSFSIFGSAPATGNFSSIQPPPGPWLRWSFNPATGQISVVSSAAQPVFSSVNVSGDNLVLNLTSGPPGSPCYIMTTTNLGLPKASWTRIATNSFDVSGNCNLTNNLSATGSGHLYVAAFVVPSP